ncbi:hypothetical protein BpHYR1_016324 [Brachionus plicatilis]|uniref:Uncharacterized protein n=1 Tax=Brachionus plicatilis TaxID=10195 RepID=A0A3M7STZ5_BRAPC|nr:hypothetical protein BpHYR1_016324 [Brachionus plicatilis]
MHVLDYKRFGKSGHELDAGLAGLEAVRVRADYVHEARGLAAGQGGHVRSVRSVVAVRGRYVEDGLRVGRRGDEADGAVGRIVGHCGYRRVEDQAAQVVESAHIADALTAAPAREQRVLLCVDEQQFVVVVDEAFGVAGHALVDGTVAAKGRVVQRAVPHRLFDFESVRVQFEQPVLGAYVHVVVVVGDVLGVLNFGRVDGRVRCVIGPARYRREEYAVDLVQADVGRRPLIVYASAPFD